jgi:hypothetical protein
MLIYKTKDGEVGKMLYLEAHKLFKRKLVCVLPILIIVLEVGGYLYQSSGYEEIQQKIEIFEKHSGILTEARIKEFWEDYQESSSDEGAGQLYYESEYLEMLIGILPNVSFDIIFGYYEGWQMFLSGFIDYIQFIPVFIAAVFSGIFTYDKVCGMQEIMLSARNGRKKCTKAKVLLAFLVANSMFLVITYIALFRMLFITQGRGWKTNIQLSVWLMESPLDMSYSVLWLHTLFLSFLAINTILLITLSVSFLAKSPVTAMCISLAILFILRPDVMDIYISDVEIAHKIISLTPCNIINTFNLAQRTPVTIGSSSVQWIYIVEVVYVILLTIGVIFFFQKLAKQQKYFAT